MTLYLLPDLNFQLRPQLLKMKPGTRIVSHMWDMGEWEPDEAFTVEGNEAFLWIVPAPVAGRWHVREGTAAGKATSTLTQQFQRDRRHAHAARQDAAVARRVRRRARRSASRSSIPMAPSAALRAQVDGNALVGTTCASPAT